MKSRGAFVVAAMCVAASAAADDVRVNFRLDTSEAVVSALGSSRSLSWRGKEGEFELEFSKRKLLLSGLALGVRKEGQYYSDGTFFTFRLFGRMPLIGRRLGIYPSLGLVYGMPGPPMMRAYGDGGHVFPIRNIDIPGSEIKGDGILYPELSVAVRLKLWRFTAEPVVGVRRIRFGTQRDGRFVDGNVLTPTIGFRVGFQIDSTK